MAAARHAIAWAWRNVHDYNGDPEKIYVSGNSSGGHLAAMLMAADWHEDFGVPEDVIKGVTGISGLYDLQPHSFVDVRAYLHLDALQTVRNSPIHHMPAKPLPLILVVGADEPAEFLRQASDYKHALEQVGMSPELLVLPEHNHFSIMAEMNRPDNELLRSIFGQMSLPRKED